MPFPLKTDLPAGDYRIVYTVDFGDKKAVHVGKTILVVNPTDVAMRKKKLEAMAAALRPAPPKSSEPPK